MLRYLFICYNERSGATHVRPQDNNKENNMKKWNAVDWIAFILVFIGGINWGLVGFFHFNLVDTLFGQASVLSRVIYAVVGLAALYQLISVSKCCSSNSSCSHTNHNN